MEFADPDLAGPHQRQRSGSAGFSAFPMTMFGSVTMAIMEVRGMR